MMSGCETTGGGEILLWFIGVVAAIVTLSKVSEAQDRKRQDRKRQDRNFVNKNNN